MKIKSCRIEAGSILAWRDYSFFTKLWRKLLGKGTPLNKWMLLPFNIELITPGDFRAEVYKPIRKYSKREIDKLYTICNVCDDVSTWSTIVTVANIVRPNTFTDSMSIDECKYYKKINLDEESDEYLY